MSSEATVTLKLAADGTVLSAELRKADAGLDKLGASGQTAGAKVAAGMEKAKREGGALDSVIGNVRKQLGALVALTGVTMMARQFLAAADAASNMSARIKLVTSSEGERVRVQGELYAIAQRTSAQLESTVALYTRMASAMRDAGASSKETLALTETINQAFAVSGATAQESASAVLQLSQALAAGALRGEEFNSVNEAAPRLMQALAESLGVSRGALRGMAEEGKLTADVIRKAFSGEQAAKIAAEFSQLPLTVGRAWQQLKNAAVSAVGQINEAGGITEGVARALQFITGLVEQAPRAFEVLTNAVKVWAGVFLDALERLPLAWDTAAEQAETMGERAKGAIGAVLQEIAILPVSLRAIFTIIIGEADKAWIGVRAGSAQMLVKVKDVWLAMQQVVIAWAGKVATTVGKVVDEVVKRMAGMVSTLAGALSFVGADESAAKLTAWAKSIDGAAQFASRFADETEAANKAVQDQREALKASALEIERAAAAQTAAADDAIQASLGERDAALAALRAKRDQSKVIADATGVVDRNTLATGANTKAGEANKESTRAQIAATADYAKAVGQLNDLLDAQAGIMGGPVVDAAMAFKAEMVKIAELEASLMNGGPLSPDALQKLALARAQAIQNYQADLASIDAEANADRLREAEQHVNAYAQIWQGGIGEWSTIIADGLMGAFDSFKEFGRSLLQSAKRVVADLIAEFLRTRVIGPILGNLFGGARGGWGQALGSLVGGSGGAGGGILSMIGGGGSGNILGALGGNGGGIGGGLLNGGGLGGLSLSQFTGGGLNASAMQSYGVLNTPTGGFQGLGGFGTALAGIGGALYGYNRTNGGLPGIGAAAAYGAAGIGIAGTAAGLAGGAGIGAAAGGAFSALGSSAIVPVVGWIMAAVAAVDMITGGKVFGTKFRPDKAVEELRIGVNGGDARASMTEVRQRSLFRGRQWRTTEQAASAEAEAAADALYAAVKDAMTGAANQLKTDVPPVIDAAIRTVTEYDKKGKVKTSQILVDIAGRTYKAKDAEEAGSRIIAEGLIAVLDAATKTAASLAKPIIGEAIGKVAAIDIGDFEGGGRRGGGIGGGDLGGAVGPALSEVQTLANRWRSDAKKLLEGAQFLVAAQTAINANGGLLGDGGTLTETTDLVEELRRGEETLSQTFARLLDSTTIMREAVEMMGAAMGTTGAEFVTLAQDIVDAAGGLDQARALWSDYFANFYSESERYAVAQARLMEQFNTQAAALGLSGDIDGEGFRAAFEAALPTLTPEQVVQWLQFAQALAAVEAQRNALAQAEQDYALWLEAMTQAAGKPLTAFQSRFAEIQAGAAQAIADANALARSRGLEGASATDLALIHRWAANQVKRAIAELEGGIRGLVDQLGYGALATVEAQIATLEAMGGSATGAIEQAGAAAENFFEQFRDGLAGLNDYLDSLLIGDLSPLSPEQQLDEARRQLAQTAAAAQGGDVAALGRLQGMADTFLRASRGFNASGSDYGADFDWVQSLLRGISNPFSAGGSGTPGTVQLVPSDELRALYAQRDELLAAEDAARRAAMAQELAGYLVELSAATGETIFAAAERLGVNFAQFVTDLGGDVGAETAEAVAALGVVANALNVELPELADQLGLALGELTDAQSLLNDAFEQQLALLPEGFRAQLEPALRDLENADTSEEQAEALDLLTDLTADLPEEFRLALAPYLSTIDPINADTFTDLDFLSTIDTNMAAAATTLRDILAELRGTTTPAPTTPGSPDVPPSPMAVGGGDVSAKSVSATGGDVVLIEEIRALRAEVAAMKVALDQRMRENTDAVKSGAAGTEGSIRRLGDDIRTNARTGR